MPPYTPRQGSQFAAGEPPRIIGVALYARRRGSYAGAEVIHMLSGSAIFLSQRAMIAVHGRPAVFAAHRAVFDLIASATTPGLGEAWKAVNTRRLNTTS